jgi:hypothetical protein
LNLGRDINVNNVTPYEPVKIARKSSMKWNKGTRVMLLDDADGNTCHTIHRAILLAVTSYSYLCEFCTGTILLNEYLRGSLCAPPPEPTTPDVATSHL